MIRMQQLKRLPCFIGHFMQQRVHLILKHTLDSRWMSFKHTIKERTQEWSTETYLWCRECCCAAHGVFHMGCLNIQSLKLVFKFVHESWNLKNKRNLLPNIMMTELLLSGCVNDTDLFQIHTLQSRVHAFHHSSHRFCDLGKKTPLWTRKRQQTSCSWYSDITLGLQQHTATYLVHRNCSLDPRCHCIHPSAHPQEVHRLVLLSDGVLCVDPRHFHVSLLDGLETT